MILYFCPLLGSGTVLYATPELRKFLLQYQPNDSHSNWLYELVYQRAKPTRLSIAVACDAEHAAAPDNLPRRGDDYIEDSFGAQTLESAAYRRGELLELPVRGMLDKDHDILWEQAHDELAHVHSWRPLAYWWGYLEGLGDRWHDGHSGKVEAAQKWLDATHASHAFVVEFGIGYQDGLRGPPHPPQPRPNEPLVINPDHE